MTKNCGMTGNATGMTVNKLSTVVFDELFLRLMYNKHKEVIKNSAK
jgi:hypothetical protein